MITQKIELLPEHIIDQIKAGEVIERPANIIKELLENAIDAGSTKIEVNIKGNGMELIHIKDNGHGIEFDDLPYAFSRHATSKLRKFEDLYSLYTYGFRGEALASVASVSKVTCKSKTDNTSGKFQIEGPRVIEHEPLETYNHQGSEFFVKDLFFNTPVRIKFLKSGQSERNQLNKILNAFLLNNPEIEFSIKWDEQEKVLYKATKSHLERVKDVIKDEFLEINNSYNNTNLKVFLGHKTSRSSLGKFQYIFLNGRMIVDRRIHNIIINSSSKLWTDGGVGNYICFLELPPNEIDVNVHPNKTVVKIFQSSNVYSLISSAVKAGIIESLGPDNLAITPTTSEAPSFLPEESLQDEEQLGFDLQENLKDLTKRYLSQDDGDDLKKYSKLTDQHYLINIEGQHYFLHLENLIRTHLVDNLSNASGKQIPLLISEPLQGNLNDLKKAEKLGFEVDRFENSFLLRAIPNFLEHYSYRESLVALDSIDFNPKKVSSIENLQSLITSPLNIFDENKISFYLSEKILVKVDGQLLNKLF